MAPPRTKAKAHLAEMLRWSRESDVGLTAMLASGFGFAGPVLFAAAAGDPAPGLAAAAGSLMIGGASQEHALRGQLRALAAALASGLAAWAVGALIAGRGGLTNLLLVLLAAPAAILGGHGRAAAVAATRFILGLLIAVALMEAAPHRLGLVLLMLAGALWTIALTLVLDAAARAYDRARRRNPPRDKIEAPRYTAAQRWARWRRSLREISGWRYPLRLTASFAAAEGVAWLWPGHHAHWIALTVVLLSRREPGATLPRSLQRALGTILGVTAASLLLAWRPSAWGLAAAMGLLGSTRPLLNARNYLLYSAVTTPLILLMMEAGRPASPGLLVDRIVATLIGVVLALAAGVIPAGAGRSPGPRSV